MYAGTRRLSTAAAAVLISLALPSLSIAWEGGYETGSMFYTSAGLVMGLGGKVSSVYPQVTEDKVPLGSPSWYLSSTSCLGHYGPLSAYGPLGTLGPIGKNRWNTSYWISAVGDWDSWSADSYGALGAEGPLGHKGPVADEQYYGEADPGKTLFETNDFAVHMRALGLWGVLGPIGPLGALGPLGPLGPIGAHGYTANSDGAYVHEGQVVRTVDVEYGAGETRTYELFEYYDEDQAKDMPDNDTSFMVRGVSSGHRDMDVYFFTSAVDQIVTVLVVPEKELDDFDLQLSISDDTKPRLVSNTGYATMDWLQVKVTAGTNMAALVSNYWSGHWLSSSYRLIVVGSGPHLNRTEISGDHVRVWK